MISLLSISDIGDLYDHYTYRQTSSTSSSNYDANDGVTNGFHSTSATGVAHETVFSGTSQFGVGTANSAFTTEDDDGISSYYTLHRTYTSIDTAGSGGAVVTAQSIETGSSSTAYFSYEIAFETTSAGTTSRYPEFVSTATYTENIVTGTTKTDTYRTSTMVGTDRSFTTVTETVNTTTNSIASATYTFKADNTNAATVSTTFREFLFSSTSASPIRQYGFNTVWIDDGIADAWVLDNGAGASHGVLTEVFRKLSAAETMFYTDYVSASVFPLMHVDVSAQVTVIGTTGTDVSTSSYTFVTTTTNIPAQGVWQGVFSPWLRPSDTATSTTTTSFSTNTYEVVTGGFTTLFAEPLTSTYLAYSTYTTSAVTTITDTNHTKRVYLDLLGEIAFTVTATTSISLFRAYTSTYTQNDYGVTDMVFADGERTVPISKFPVADSAGAAQFGFNFFRAASPSGCYAPFGDYSSAGPEMFRDLSVSMVSSDSRNNLPFASIENMAFGVWGVMGFNPFVDYGGGFAQQNGGLNQLITLKQAFPIWIYTSSTTTASSMDSTGGTSTYNTTTSGALLTQGSAKILSTRSDTMQVALTIPHTTTRTTSTSTQPSTLKSQAYVTGDFILGLPLDRTDIQPWELAPTGAGANTVRYGGAPVDHGRADILQYLGLRAYRTSNHSNGVSVLGSANYTAMRTENAPTDAVVFERQYPLYDVDPGGGGGVQAIAAPRYFLGVVDPVF